MGNLCSVVLRAIDYILHLIFPRYTTFMYEGYSSISEKHSQTAFGNNRSSRPEISDSFSNPGYGRYNRVEEPEANEHHITPGEDNTESIRSIVNKFFEVHNLQRQALTQNITEEFLDLCSKVNNVSSKNTTKNTNGKEIRDNSKSEERQVHHTNIKGMHQISSVKRPKDSTANKKDKTSALNASLYSEDKENDSYLANKAISVDTIDCRIKKYLTDKAKINMKCVENPEYHRKKCCTIPSKEIPKDQKEKCENCASSSKKMTINNHSDHAKKSDMVRSKEVIQNENVPCENFSSSSKEILSDSYSNDEYANDVEIGKNKKHSLHKISLYKLYSGSHYAVVDNDGNIELSDYIKEFPPLQVEEGICYRNFTHPKLLSGVTVVFEELSDHLSIPNWYKEDPIACNEIPDDINIPQSSPIKLQQVTFSRSSSGGGIVSGAASQRVHLPDLFPSPSPLSQTYSPLVNTQSSTSFGELQTSTDETTEIFTDLINQSIAHDTKLTSKVPEEENK